MEINEGILTKSDYLLYCEAPRHLWAKKNGKISQVLSEFEQHLTAEGYEVEALAREYFQNDFRAQRPGCEVSFQQTFTDGSFEARADILLFDPTSSTYEVYEVKSCTKLDKKELNDVAYQFLIYQKHLNVAGIYIVHPNKEYIRSGDLDLEQFFSIVDKTEDVLAILPEVDQLRHDALAVLTCQDPEDLAQCLAPRECPCPEICHPNLPEFSIYDIPRLYPNKKLELISMGIRDGREVPVNFPLNEKQWSIVERARTNSEFIDKYSLQRELEKLIFPIWFLDYETCISAIPRFDGYHAQQQIVFQYSLHRLDSPTAEPEHRGCISVSDGDPSVTLLKRLSVDFGKKGSVIVWNKAFEMTRNKEMAQIHPENSNFLQDLNSRIYDLGEIVNQGIYLHPQFKGSWSIKHVLPVMVPELSYEEMDINKGDKASMAWWEITFGERTDEEKANLLAALDKYCELDTLAMVEIYKRFVSMV